MPKKNFKNFGEMQGYEYLKGVISSVDGDTDTCTLSINGAEHSSVPIYYHCTEDAEERSNGAIEGAAAGFSGDDEVIVLKQCEGLESKIFVIGHIDGARACDGSGAFVQIAVIGGSGWTYPIRYYLWDLWYNREATIKDSEGATVAQPCELSDITWFIESVGLERLVSKPTFTNSKIYTEHYPWLESSPVVSHVAAMEGGVFYNNSTRPAGTSPYVFTDNVHNWFLNGYNISYLQSSESSCFVGSNSRQSTYVATAYMTEDCDGLPGPFWIGSRLTETRSFEIQTPLGVINTISVPYSVTNKYREDCHDYWTLGAYSHDNPCGIGMALTMNAGADAYLQSFFFKWNHDRRTGVGLTGLVSYSYERCWDIAIAARYGSNVDVTTMTRADYTAGGRNTALEEYVKSKISTFMSDNNILLEDSGTPGEVLNPVIDNDLNIQLALYGIDFD